MRFQKSELPKIKAWLESPECFKFIDEHKGSKSVSLIISILLENLYEDRKSLIGDYLTVEGWGFSFDKRVIFIEDDYSHGLVLGFFSKTNKLIWKRCPLYFHEFKLPENAKLASILDLEEEFYCCQ